MKAQKLLEKLGSGIREGNYYKADYTSGKEALNLLRGVLLGYANERQWEPLQPDKQSAKKYSQQVSDAVDVLKQAEDALDLVYIRAKMMDLVQ